MRNPFLYLVLCVGWIVAGAWMWSKASCCNISNPLSIKDGTTAIVADGGNIRFGMASAAAIIPEDIKTKLAGVTSYLKAEPGRTFNITGLYDKDEKNGSSFSSMGMGRAEAVKAYFVGQGIAASRIITSDQLSENLVIDNSEVVGPLTYGFGSRGISISDGAKFSASDFDNFVFDKSGFVHSTPISDKLNGVMTQTATYLKANPDRSLNITGFYHEKEEYKGILPTLGMARANDIKGLLVGLGAGAGQINMDSKMETSLPFDADKLWGGLAYEFAGTATAGKDLEAIRKRLQANPIILYFATGDATLNLSAQQREDLADIIYYLDRTPNGQIQSSGHTDDRGDYNGNVRLSSRRAEFVRNYIAGNSSIPASKIMAAGSGPDVPIGDNSTEEGRQKNRRVEITIK